MAERPDRDQSQTKNTDSTRTATNGDGRAARATASAQSEGKRAERATTADSTKSRPTETEHRKNTATDDTAVTVGEFRTKNEEGNREEPTGLGERITQWLGLDTTFGAASSTVRNISGFAQGVGVFVGKYFEMQSRNVKKADHYFHCSANCEAAALGPGGTVASILMSHEREAIDVVGNVARGKLSPQASVDDSARDFLVNDYGRAGGTFDRQGIIRCSDWCSRFRPRGL